MSSITYLRQLHRIKVEFEKDSMPRKGVLFLRKGPRFGCVMDSIFIYYVHEKSLDFERFIMPGNKLLL